MSKMQTSFEKVAKLESDVMSERKYKRKRMIFFYILKI